GSLEVFIEKNRSSAEYAVLRQDIRDIALEIALGSATTSASAKDRSLLTVTANASRILELQSPEGQRPEEQLARIQDLIGQAEKAILKHDTYQEAMTHVDAAIENRRPLELLDARKKLLVRYPEFESDEGLRQRISRAMEIEQELIAPVAETEEPV